MSIVAVTPADVELLQQEYPSLDFAHPERIAVLNALDSIDVQAAPGSGKTTLLAAKLSMLARKWPFDRRGICVVTHTNVAREEIEARLRESQAGAALFTHPHFIGTIQSFIHTFLALPLIRSWGGKVQVIDDDEWRRRAEMRVQADYTLRALAANSPNKYGAALRSLRYLGHDLHLASAEGQLPSVSAKSYQKIRSLKAGLSADGVFRYDDMFAFAQHVLEKYPSVRDALGFRFPLVFVDEMQDTSEAQAELLQKAMGAVSVFQRFGDLNQRILRPHDNAAAPFPRGTVLQVSISKRFGAPIAAVANLLRVEGANIVGDGPASDGPVLMFTFTDDSVTKVVQAFYDAVVQHVPVAERDSHGIKAICARKDETSTLGCGRFLGDYLPAGYEVAPKKSRAAAILISALRDARRSRNDLRNLADVTRDVRAALLHLFKECKWLAAQQASDWRKMMFDAPEVTAIACGALVEHLVSAPPPCEVAEEWDDYLLEFAAKLSALFGRVVTREELRRHEATRFIASNGAITAEDCANEEAEQPDGFGAGTMVAVDTIAGVKGETHAATLVLESILNRRYDIKEALPFLCGEASSLAASDLTTIARLRNLFVAATRPRNLLAFAMHRDRLSHPRRQALEARGWKVVDVD